MGAPIWPPNPPAFGAPRETRGAPLLRAQHSPNIGGRFSVWSGAGEGGGRRARELLRARARIGEGEQRGVQADAANRIGGRPERAIADERMSEGCELGADLAAPSGAHA